jgi:hypothetical protein
LSWWLDHLYSIGQLSPLRSGILRKDTTKLDQPSIIDTSEYNKMKLNIIIISLIANYAAASSIPERALRADMEARQDYIGELCTAPIV